MVVRTNSLDCSHNFGVSNMEKKSPSSGKPPWDGFNLSRCDLIGRWNTVPLYQRGLPQQGAALPHPKIYQSVGNLRPLQRPPTSWARQQGILTAQTLPLPAQQMTVGAVQARGRPQQMRMDSSFYGDKLPTTQTLSEHSLTGDLSSFDSSVFASSPNSLYMYELEKADMQSSFGNVPNSSNPGNLFFSDDFDLKDTYETSQDIGPVCDSQIHEELDSQSLDNPTLAELNFAPLMDDMVNLTSTSSSLPLTPGQRSSAVQKILSTSVGERLSETWALLQNKQEKVETQTSLPSAWSMGISSPSTTAWSGREMSSPSATDCFLTRQILSNKSVSNKQSILARQISETVSNSTNVKTELPPLSDIQNIGGEIKSANKQDVKPLIRCKSSPSPPQVTHNTPSTSALGKRRSPQSTVTFDPSNVDVDQKWEEIRQFIHDDEPNLPTRPKMKRESIDSIGSLTSMDDGDSDDGSSSDEEWNSDTDSEDNQDTSWGSKKKKDSTSKKERQYFWQYNIQSKGPKGTRLNFDLEPKNPHVLLDFEDPVFDVEKGKKIGLGVSVRHGGKARKGDGNNVEPNPKKLGQIGLQLKKINKQINSFAPLCDLPVSTRNKSKKEKNKLASRACRLKKKAQHEAYKVKLYGLELEHKQLMTVMEDIKARVMEVIEEKDSDKEKINLTKHLEDLIKENLTVMVAGHTTEFVNSVIKKVEDGDPTGGLGT